MAILDKTEQDKILGEWTNIASSKRIFKPIEEKIEVNPYVKKEIYDDSYIKKDAEHYGKYKQEIREYLASRNHKRITNLCYLYVTFRRTPHGENQPIDVDNLLKGFFDAIKEKGEVPKKTPGTLVKNDDQIIGVKANLVKLSKNEEGSVSFTLIPTCDLEIISVTEIKKKDKSLGRLNELRKRYWEQVGENPDDLINWNYPMQMVETNLGTFFDNTEGSLWGIESYGEEFLHKPEPGFDWKPKIGEKVKGVTIYERSFCWWINKWAE